MSDVKHYAVIGNPIEQSRSPDIHRLFAQQTGEKIVYDKLLSREEQFERDLKAFFSGNGHGMNVTAPFKQLAYQIADDLSEQAKLAGAVNTLIKMPDGNIFGDTTDGIGLVNDFKLRGWDIDNQRVLIVGAGGAVRGVIDPILRKNPCELVIANRTLEKAEMLRNLFEGFGRVNACGFNDLKQEKFDIVINGTSASLQGKKLDLPKTIFGSTAKAYDMAYSANLTPFLRWVKSQGVKHYQDGLGMLVCQAAESFSLWRGVKPKVKPVIEALRAHLKMS